MTKETVFINLRGRIGDYAPLIKRETKTRSVEIQGLEYRLNEEIKKWRDTRATADNCSLFWNSLSKEFKRVKVTPTDDVQRRAYDEIMECIRNIGKEVAYFTFRSGAYFDIDVYLKEWWKEMQAGRNGYASVAFKKYIVAVISLKGTPEDFAEWEGADWEENSDYAFNNGTEVRRYCEWKFGEFTFVNKVAE